MNKFFVSPGNKNDNSKMLSSPKMTKFEQLILYLGSTVFQKTDAQPQAGPAGRGDTRCSQEVRIAVMIWTWSTCSKAINLFSESAVRNANKTKENKVKHVYQHWNGCAPHNPGAKQEQTEGTKRTTKPLGGGTVIPSKYCLSKSVHRNALHFQSLKQCFHLQEGMSPMSLLTS